MLKAMERIQKRLFQSRFKDYLLLAALATVPVILSWAWGMARSAALAYGPSGSLRSAVCHGYCQRINWVTLVLTLPLALFVLRYSAQVLFNLSRRESSTSIPDLETGASPEEVLAFHAALYDSKNLLYAFLITLCLNMLDLWLPAYYFWHAKHGAPPNPMPPKSWDWTAWFLSRPGDDWLYYKNLILVVVAYASQFILVFFAVSLVIMILRHNRFYLDRIYIRARVRNGDPKGFIVLDFDDVDGRFGLMKLASQFNHEIKLLSVAAAFTIFSRLANADTSQVDKSLDKLTISILFSKEKLLEMIPSDPRLLFPTTGQLLFPVVWSLMFLIVFLPARAKLLPLGYLEASARGLRNYLTQFVLPGSSNEPKNDPESVNILAQKFRAQAFWPVGDGNAEYLSIGAFFVFFLIIAPVLPRNLKHLLYYIVLAFASYCSSKILFSYFKFRLSRIDERLVKAEKGDNS